MLKTVARQVLKIYVFVFVMQLLLTARSFCERRHVKGKHILSENKSAGVAKEASYTPLRFIHLSVV